MMPQKLIQKIKSEQVDDGSDKWTYRASGNVLELLVLPQFVHNKKAFRCSVISAGQALASLKAQYNKAGNELFIQTFPNIENPKVICSIRVDDSGYSNTDSIPQAISLETKDCSIDDFLLETAEKFHLNTQSAYLSDEVLKMIGIDTHFDHTYLLVSRLDNPFTWLKAGYWKESIIQYMKLHEPTRKYFLYHFSNHREEFKKHTDLNNGTYLQGILCY